MITEIRAINDNDQTEIEELFLLKNSHLKWHFTEFLQDKNCHALVFCENQKIVGFGALICYHTPLHGKIGRLEDIFINPEFRGKGYGKKIIKSLVEIGTTLKLNHLTLTSNQTRLLARQIYIDLGFEKYETEVFVKKS